MVILISKSTIISIHIDHKWYKFLFIYFGDWRVGIEYMKFTSFKKLWKHNPYKEQI